MKRSMDLIISADLQDQWMDLVVVGEFRAGQIAGIIGVLINVWFRGVFVQIVNCRFLWFMGLFTLFVVPTQAGKAVDQLDAFLASSGAMSADFVQTVQGAAFSQSKESRGTLIMQRPGKFRWDYQTPYKQLILADGKRLWIYDEDLAQVVVKPLNLALGDTPALLVSGKSLAGKLCSGGDRD